jgi:hypothetical protein
MSARKRKKVYPQVIAIELILIAAAAVLTWFLLPLAGASHGVALFAAGAATDRALILVLRHRNKRLLPAMPITVKRTPAPRKAAPRRPAARRP